MPVVQPVLETVTHTHTHTYIYIYKPLSLCNKVQSINQYIYMIIVGKSMPIDNYEHYKRVINQITGRLYMHVYILETKKLFDFVVVVVVCVCLMFDR